MPALHIVSILREILFKCCPKTYPTITMLSLEFNDAMTRTRDISSGNAKCRKYARQDLSKTVVKLAP